MKFKIKRNKAAPAKSKTAPARDCQSCKHYKYNAQTFLQDQKCCFECSGTNSKYERKEEVK